MITKKAWAKINLGLKIIDRREDNYHNIETTLSTINLADILNINEMSDGIIIESIGLDIKPEENLCYRAAQLFKTRYKIDKGIEIKLIKNIPVGAGLGGGSSDAAAVLIGLNELFNVKIATHDLAVLGSEIGMDVPFFVKGGAAYARGRGDELKFFKLPRMDIVLYYPGYSISTKWAYEEFDRTGLTPTVDLNKIFEKEGKKKKKPRTGFSLQNDFERIVFKKHPDLLDVKTHMLAEGALLVSLTGSGSCLYAIVDDQIRKKITKYLDNIGAQYYELSTI